MLSSLLRLFMLLPCLQQHHLQQQQQQLQRQQLFEVLVIDFCNIFAGTWFVCLFSTATTTTTAWANFRDVAAATSAVIAAAAAATATATTATVGKTRRASVRIQLLNCSEVQLDEVSPPLIYPPPLTRLPSLLPLPLRLRNARSCCCCSFLYAAFIDFCGLVSFFDVNFNYSNYSNTWAALLLPEKLEHFLQVIVLPKQMSHTRSRIRFGCAIGCDCDCNFAFGIGIGIEFEFGKRRRKSWEIIHNASADNFDTHPHTHTQTDSQLATPTPTAAALGQAGANLLCQLS